MLKECVHNDFRLDGIPDWIIDLEFAISCFTHLIERDCRTYFNEIRRVLKPDGAAYIRGFMIDRYFFEYVERTGLFLCIYGPGFLWWLSKRKWNEMIEEAGLYTICYNTGDWAKKPGASNY